MSKDDEHTTCRMISTSVGPIFVTVDSAHVLAIRFGAEMGPSIDSFEGGDSALLQETTDQLNSYFSGALKHFDLPLSPAGTPFQQRVWDTMRTIDYGSVLSYGEIATRLGNPHLARPVGGAANKNPIPIIIPCHRVVGANGWIGGFAPGVAYKKTLLELEGWL